MISHYSISPNSYCFLFSSLNSFISLIKDWLEENADYEAIVDGANIGLYQQNFAEGGFSLLQVVYPTVGLFPLLFFALSLLSPNFYY